MADLSPEQRAQKLTDDIKFAVTREEVDGVILRAFREAEQRGRLQGLEEAAKIAEFITADARWTDACKIIAKEIRELKNTQSKSSENKE